jgi:DNA polymerase (family 10)
MVPTNREVAALLERHGLLLEIAGESPFRTRAYTRAAEGLRLLQGPLSDYAAEGRLREIPGVGEGIAAAISELLTTGHYTAHDELTRRFPESLLELTAVPGIGPKTTNKLFTLLGVVSIEGLEAAITTGQIAKTKGLGARTETTARDGLAAVRRRTGRRPLGTVLPLARSVVALYTAARPRDKISIAGSARRWEATVADLDFVIASNDFARSVEALRSLPMVVAVNDISNAAVQLDLGIGLLADVFLTSFENWGSTLVRVTGNTRHLDLLRTILIESSTEEEVYRANGMPWIPPELRYGELEFQRCLEIPQLVELVDINGELHTHTTWSDGTASLEEMAAAAANRGYSFLGITDHSHGLGVAGGLDVAKLLEQRSAIAAASRSAAIRLLQGAEVEVHRNGSLDFDENTLANLDVVVASLHTGLRQPQEELTERLVRVLHNPNVDIIAHPSGRLIERREGGDFDWDRVFATAATTGTALEINADPARLDLDPHLARKASEAGCLISINCDAHGPDGFALMEYGVAMARRSWLRPRQILNCWPRKQVLDWLSARSPVP